MPEVTISSKDDEETRKRKLAEIEKSRKALKAAREAVRRECG